MKRLYLIIVSSLTLIGILQMGWLTPEIHDLVHLLGLQNRTAIWRGVYFGRGQRAADFIDFIRDHTPGNAAIVLPPVEDGPKGFNSTPYMQFVLLPRRVSNCLDQDCLADRAGRSALLIFSQHELERLGEAGGRYLPFDSSWGLYLPAGMPPADSSSEISPFEIYKEILLATLWLGMLAWSGFWGLGWLLDGSPLEKMVFGSGLMLAVYTLILAVISLAGLPLAAPLLWGLTILLLAGVFAVRRVTRLKHPTGKQKSVPAPFDPWITLIFVFGLISVLLSTGRGYSVTDEVQIWGLKGYGIAQEHSIQNVTAWGTNSAAYPLHLPLLIASFRIMFQDNLPISKVIPSLYYVCLLFLIRSSIARRQANQALAHAALFITASSLLIFRHSTIALTNLPMAHYLVAGVFWSSRLLESTHSNPVGWKAASLAGLSWVAAAWSRPEGSWLVFGAVLWLVGLFSTLRSPRSWKVFGPLLASLTAYSIFWGYLSTRLYPQPLPIAAINWNAFVQIRQGSWHLAEAWYLLKAFLERGFDIKSWGGLMIACLPLAMLLLAKSIELNRTVFYSIGSGLLFGAILFAGYYLTSYDTRHDISWWVNTGLERMVLPAVLTLWLGIIAGLQFLYERVHRPVPLDA